MRIFVIYQLCLNSCVCIKKWMRTYFHKKMKWIQNKFYLTILNFVIFPLLTKIKQWEEKQLIKCFFHANLIFYLNANKLPLPSKKNPKFWSNLTELKTLEWDILNPNYLIWEFLRVLYIILNGAQNFKFVGFIYATVIGWTLYTKGYKHKIRLVSILRKRRIKH